MEETQCQRESATLCGTAPAENLHTNDKQDSAGKETPSVTPSSEKAVGSGF